VVNGVTLSDYGSDGGISFEPQSDEVESQLSADGLVNYSANHDRRMRATITVMAHSFAAQYLDARYRAQKRNLESDGSLGGETFFFFNPATGEKIASGNLVFVTIPSYSVEKSEGERDFVVELPYGRDGEQPGTLGVPPVRI